MNQELIMRENPKTENLHKEIVILKLELSEVKQSLAKENFKQNTFFSEKLDLKKTIASLSEALEKSEEKNVKLRKKIDDLENQLRSIKISKFIPEIVQEFSDSELSEIEQGSSNKKSNILRKKSEEEDVVENNTQLKTHNLSKMLSSITVPSMITNDVKSTNQRVKEIEISSLKENFIKQRAELRIKTAMVNELQMKLKETREQAQASTSALQYLRREEEFKTLSSKKDLMSSSIAMMNSFFAKLKESYGLCVSLLEDGDDKKSSLLRLEKSLNDCTTMFTDIKDGLFNE